MKFCRWNQCCTMHLLHNFLLLLGLPKSSVSSDYNQFQQVCIYTCDSLFWSPTMYTHLRRKWSKMKIILVSIEWYAIVYPWLPTKFIHAIVFCTNSNYEEMLQKRIEIHWKIGLKNFMWVILTSQALSDHL